MQKVKSQVARRLVPRMMKGDSIITSRIGMANVFLQMILFSTVQSAQWNRIVFLEIVDQAGSVPEFSDRGRRNSTDTAKEEPLC